MKHNLILLGVVCVGVAISGCGSTLAYNSRGQNSLDLDNPQYQNATVDQVKAKTGRFFFWRVNFFQPENNECLPRGVE